MEEIYQPTVFFGWRVFRARWMEMDDEMTTMWKRVTAKKAKNDLDEMHAVEIKLELATREVAPAVC